MNEFEALEKKGYLHKSFRKRGRKHTCTDMSFSVPHHFIEALRKADHAINTIQKILLQSLENFEGILIATTNLSFNLDKAFERRFTFRIEFPMPDAGARKRVGYLIPGSRLLQWRMKSYGIDQA